MGRHIAQIAIALSIGSLYSIFFFAKEINFNNYVMISNLVGLCFIFSFIVEIRSHTFLKKEYFKAFALTHSKLIIKRISLYYKRLFLWCLLVLPPLLMLFINLPLDQKVAMTLLSIAQNIFTVYLFLSFYDFIERKGYERHISLLPAILSISLTAARNSHGEKFYYINPFGGIINLPLLAHPYFYLTPILLFVLLYIFNNYYAHHYWVKD